MGLNFTFFLLNQAVDYIFWEYEEDIVDDFNRGVLLFDQINRNIQN